jgi:hypothetical protein
MNQLSAQRRAAAFNDAMRNPQELRTERDRSNQSSGHSRRHQPGQSPVTIQETGSAAAPEQTRATIGRASTSHAGKECLRDIAYYNIHTGLLAALIDFRRHYFDDESFLPETLRWKGLEDAAKLVDGP